MSLEKNIPFETENGINLGHPDVMFFRKLILERVAQKQNSDIWCPECKTNLPYNQITVAACPSGIKYFCPLCQDYFK